MSTKGGERWKRGDLCYDDLGNSKFDKEKLSVGSACEGYLISYFSSAYPLIVYVSSRLSSLLFNVVFCDHKSDP